MWPDILLFVGDQYISTHMLSQTEVANGSSFTRVERARTLHQAWLTQSIPHEYAAVAGMSHNELITPIIRWSMCGDSRAPLDMAVNRLDAYLPEVRMSANCCAPCGEAIHVSHGGSGDQRRPKTIAEQRH